MAPNRPVSADDLHEGTRARVISWAADPEVEGVVWVGSRSRGYGGTLSDDDLEVALAPQAFARLAPEDTYEMAPVPGAEPPRLIYDAQYTTLATLEAKAASPRDLDHWPYERAIVLADRDGRVAAAVAAAARMDAAFRQARILHGALDVASAIGRARKTGERGFPAAKALIVARGAKALSRVIFALEGRWVPLDHWLEPELATLEDAAGAGPLLASALMETRHQPLKEALDRLQPQLEREGFPPISGLSNFFSAMMHPDRAAERAIHGLA